MNITADGKYKINIHSMSKSIVYVRGNVGTAILTLESFGIPLVDGVISIDTQTQINHGVDVELILDVAGGVTDIDVRCVGIH